MGAKKRKDKDSQQKTEQKTSSSFKQDVKVDERPGIPYKRLALRFVLIIGIMMAANLYTKWRTSESFASHSEVIDHKFVSVPCSKDYEQEKAQFPECIPKRCGRTVMDNVIDMADVNHLLRMAKTGIALGGSNGGASILDLHSGALSDGDKFIDVYQKLKQMDTQVFTEKDFATYRRVKNKIHATIANEFNVPAASLYLTSPTFFSRMTTKAAKTIHDEYWHVHVDKETYGSFHYTSLLYLTTYDSDFTGGRFIFTDHGQNVTVEPKSGRLSFFTSGSENPHFVEKLRSGIRFAITVSFTCDSQKAISDPVLKM